ncbi:MAG: hypothetical protein E7647_06205 [Ruminococcaceae bacterium]|nr:hypothetical protein [Oscillospiraceae bacterium]
MIHRCLRCVQGIGKDLIKYSLQLVRIQLHKSSFIVKGSALTVKGRDGAADLIDKFLNNVADLLKESPVLLCKLRKTQNRPLSPCLVNSAFVP